MDAWFGQGGCVAVHHADPGLVIAGGQGTSQTSNWSFALARSANGGLSWTRSFIEQNERGWCRALAVAPSDPDYVYAGGWVISAGAVAVSTDRGATWTRTAAPPETVFGLAVHPHDPQTAFAATAGGVYRSADAGGNWTRLLSWPGVRTIVLLPGAPDTVIAGGDRGVRASWNAGADWVSFDEGLEGREVLAFAVSSSDAVRLFAGTGNGSAYRYEFTTGVSGPEERDRPAGRFPTLVRSALELPPARGPAGLFDAAGRQVMTLQPGRNETGHLSPGVYFIRPEAGDRGQGFRVLLLP